MNLLVWTLVVPLVTAAIGGLGGARKLKETVMVAGLVASVVGVHSMFPLMAVGAFVLFLAADASIQRWKHRTLAPAVPVVGEPSRTPVR